MYTKFPSSEKADIPALVQVVKPFEVAKKWAVCVTDEFFLQVATLYAFSLAPHNLPSLTLQGPPCFCIPFLLLVPSSSHCWVLSRMPLQIHVASRSNESATAVPSMRLYDLIVTGSDHGATVVCGL